MIKSHKLYYIFVIFLVLPVFFQLKNNIYTGQDIISKDLYFLPIPISFLSLFFFLILVQSNNFNLTNILKEKSVIVFLLCFFFIFAYQVFNYGLKSFKIIYLIQFYLPILGFLLGYFYYKPIFFFILYRVLLFFFLVHLSISFISGKFILVENLYFFSIYQNFQYVNTTLIFLSVLTLIFIKDNVSKSSFLFFYFVSFFYSIFSYSLNSIFIYLIGTLIVFSNFYFAKKKNIILFIISIVIFFFSFASIKNEFSNFSFKGSDKKNHYLNTKKIDDILSFSMPQNINLRLEIWKIYLQEINKNKQILITGSKNFDLDKKYGSAHNLFLDIIYKFGLILTIPFFYLFYVIISKVFHEKKMYKKKIIIITLIFIVLENFFKVSLKQPYSGYLTYYILSIILLNKNFNKTISSKLFH